MAVKRRGMPRLGDARDVKRWADLLVAQLNAEQEAPPLAGPTRPADAPDGAMFFDTSLHKPIWRDGALWRDATGTAV